MFLTKKELQSERWKIISGFENYEVSDLGRVRRKIKACGTFAGKIIKPTVGKRGYLHIGLYTNKKQITVLVHRLVALAFIPNPKHLPEVNHLSTLDDCRAIKLEWRSKKGNIQYSVKKRKGKGVRYVTRDKRWVAYYNDARAGYHSIYLGYFKTKREAQVARRKAIDSLHKKEIL